MSTPPIAPVIRCHDVSPDIERVLRAVSSEVRTIVAVDDEAVDETVAMLARFRDARR